MGLFGDLGWFGAQYLFSEEYGEKQKKQIEDEYSKIIAEMDRKKNNKSISTSSRSNTPSVTSSFNRKKKEVLGQRSSYSWTRTTKKEEKVVETKTPKVEEKKVDTKEDTKEKKPKVSPSTSQTSSDPKPTVVKEESKKAANTIPHEQMFSDIVKESNDIAKSTQQLITDIVNRNNDIVESESVSITIPVVDEPKQQLKSPLPEANPVQFQQQIYTSQGIFNKFPDLIEIQKYAQERQLSINCKEIAFPTIPENSGIVEVAVYNAQGKFLPYKSFIIDYGRIIDTRTKLFPFPDNENISFEFYKPYSLYFVPKNAKKGDKLPVNRNLIKAMFKSGITGISGMRSMYSDEIEIVNRFVDLISIPNTVERDKIIYLCGKMCAASVFWYAVQVAGGNRWYLVKNTGDEIRYDNFILINGAPAAYGGLVKSTKKCSIVSTRDPNGIHIIQILCGNSIMEFVVDKDTGDISPVVSPIE